MSDRLPIELIKPANPVRFLKLWGKENFVEHGRTSKEGWEGTNWEDGIR